MEWYSHEDSSARRSSVPCISRSYVSRTSHQGACRERNYRDEFNIDTFSNLGFTHSDILRVVACVMSLRDIEETIEFLRFAHDSSTQFKGTVAFDITCNDAHRVYVINLSDSKPHITSFEPSAAKIEPVDCYVSMDGPTFLQVYSGELPAHTAIISGRVSVRRFAYSTLKSFCGSFDFRSETWDRFYQEVDLTALNIHQSKEETLSEDDFNVPDVQSYILRHRTRRLVHPRPGMPFGAARFFRSRLDPGLKIDLTTKLNVEPVDLHPINIEPPVIVEPVKKSSTSLLFHRLRELVSTPSKFPTQFSQQLYIVME